LYINALEKEETVQVKIVDHNSIVINDTDVIEQLRKELPECNIELKEDEIYICKKSLGEQCKNKGVLIGLITGMLIAEKNIYKQILIDDELVYNRWSHGKGKFDTQTKMMAIWCDDLSKNYLEKGGTITKILEDENKSKFC